MIDRDEELRERFAELRDEDQRSIPQFTADANGRRRTSWRPMFAIAALLLIVMTIAIRSRSSRFSDSDRAAVVAVARWHPATDFLLNTPGSEMLTTTPRIPDLKGIAQ